MSAPVYGFSATKVKHFGLKLTTQTWYPLWNTHLEWVTAAARELSIS